MKIKKLLEGIVRAIYAWEARAQRQPASANDKINLDSESFCIFLPLTVAGTSHHPTRLLSRPPPFACLIKGTCEQIFAPIGGGWVARWARLRPNQRATKHQARAQTESNCDGRGTHKEMWDRGEFDWLRLRRFELWLERIWRNFWGFHVRRWETIRLGSQKRRIQLVWISKENK